MLSLGGGILPVRRLRRLLRLERDIVLLLRLLWMRLVPHC